MGLVLRTLLIWLLVLAVPAQGAAAVTMAFCGPNHHGGGSASFVQPAAAATHEHHGADAGLPHGHHDAATQPDQGDTMQGAAKADANADVAWHKCSVCASCCSPGAVLSTVLTVPAPPVAAAVFAAVVPSVDPFAADGPDRPPRSVLA